MLIGVCTLPRIYFVFFAPFFPLPYSSLSLLPSSSTYTSRPHYPRHPPTLLGLVIGHIHLLFPATRFAVFDRLVLGEEDLASILIFVEDLKEITGF